jgi:hypothetical protein
MVKKMELRKSSLKIVGRKEKIERDCIHSFKKGDLGCFANIKSLVKNQL